jgi:hypothetical protein
MPATQPLAPETAFAAIQERVYNPCFFAKLAQDYGIQPADAEEARQMLGMAEQLRTAYHQAQPSSKNLLKAAAAQLQAQLGGQTAPADAAVIKQAATEAASDPQLANAVLSLFAAAQPAA